MKWEWTVHLCMHTVVHANGVHIDQTATLHKWVVVLNQLGYLNCIMCSYIEGINPSCL